MHIAKRRANGDAARRGAVVANGDGDVNIGTVGPWQRQVGDDLWETPTYSASGEDVSGGTPEEGLYAWVAGESRTVARVRRLLVNEVGLPRRQVAFMGYWRQGVAMRG